MADIKDKLRRLLASTGRPNMVLAVVAGVTAWMVTIFVRWMVG
jgi:hypothetical protein